MGCNGGREQPWTIRCRSTEICATRAISAHWLPSLCREPVVRHHGPDAQGALCLCRTRHGLHNLDSPYIRMGLWRGGVRLPRVSAKGNKAPSGYLAERKENLFDAGLPRAAVQRTQHFSVGFVPASHERRCRNRRRRGRRTRSGLARRGTKQQRQRRGCRGGDRTNSGTIAPSAHPTTDIGHGHTCGGPAYRQCGCASSCRWARARLGRTISHAHACTRRGPAGAHGCLCGPRHGRLLARRAWLHHFEER